MEKLQIVTYLKDESGNLKLLDNINRWVARIPGHMSGAVEISKGAELLVSKEMKTDPFYWWAQIPIMLCQVLETNNALVTGYFPDIAVSMDWKINASNLKWSIHGRNSKSINFQLRPAIKTVFLSCRKAITKMQDIYPDMPGGYHPIISKLDYIETHTAISHW